MVLVGAGTPGGNAVVTSGDLVVLETENQSVGNVIKRIFPVGEDLVLVSANPVEQHDPIVLKKAEVSRMWRVRGVLFETVTV